MYRIATVILYIIKDMPNQTLKFILTPQNGSWGCARQVLGGSWQRADLMAAIVALRQGAGGGGRRRRGHARAAHMRRPCCGVAGCSLRGRAGPVWMGQIRRSARVAWGPRAVAAPG